MDSDFDYYQEIARSGFGDMLHDLERNNKYYEGIKKVIPANPIEIPFTDQRSLSRLSPNCGRWDKKCMYLT